MLLRSHDQSLRRSQTKPAVRTMEPTSPRARQHRTWGRHHEGFDTEVPALRGKGSYSSSVGAIVTLLDGAGRSRGSA